jgi:hypothetical protein
LSLLGLYEVCYTGAELGNQAMMKLLKAFDGLEI